MTTPQSQRELSTGEGGFSDLRCVSLGHQSPPTSLECIRSMPSGNSLSSTLPHSTSPGLTSPGIPREDVQTSSNPTPGKTKTLSCWQADPVTISQFVRSFPERQGLWQRSQGSSTESASKWADLPQIEAMIAAGYTRPATYTTEAVKRGRLIGSGGQAKVYQASIHDGNAVHAVVLKQFTGEHGDDEMTAEEVDTELSACCVLRGHHHVAPIIGVVESTDVDVPRSRLISPQQSVAAGGAATVRGVIMQRFSGSLLGTLEKLRGADGTGGEERALSTEVLLRIVLALSNALACAHRRGMLHMDVKPGNVLVQETACGVLAYPHPLSTSAVALTDFGTSILPWDARAVHGLCGTLDYHPPELALSDMKFAAELCSSSDDDDISGACAAADAVRCDSSSFSTSRLARSSGSALGVAGGPQVDAVFNEKMDVWGLGVLMFECVAEHLPLEDETDPHVILRRVATGTVMASAAPTFALLPCHKAIKALCQWATAPRAQDRPTARQVHAAAAEMLVSLREHAAGGSGECGEVVACGEVLTLGRASRVHAPDAAGATDAFVAAVPLVRPGDVMTHPRVGVVSTGGARPSPDPFAGPLPADVAEGLQVIIDRHKRHRRAASFSRVLESYPVADISTLASPRPTVEPHGAAAAMCTTPSPGVLSQAILDHILFAGPGFGRGGAAASPKHISERAARNDALVAAIRNSFFGPNPDCPAERPARHDALGAHTSGYVCNAPIATGDCACCDAHHSMPAAAGHRGVVADVFRQRVALMRQQPPVHASDPTLHAAAAPSVTAVVSAMATGPPADVGGSPPRGAVGPIRMRPAYMPTLPAIPSVSESGALSTSESECASPPPVHKNVPAFMPHDIMETAVSAASSLDSGFEDGLCMRAVARSISGGTPGNPNNITFVEAAAQRRSAPGSIFFVESPRAPAHDSVPSATGHPSAEFLSIDGAARLLASITDGNDTDSRWGVDFMGLTAAATADSASGGEDPLAGFMFGALPCPTATAGRSELDLEHCEAQCDVTSALDCADSNGEPSNAGRLLAQAAVTHECGQLRISSEHTAGAVSLPATPAALESGSLEKPLGTVKRRYARLKRRLRGFVPALSNVKSLVETAAVPGNEGVAGAPPLPGEAEGLDEWTEQRSAALPSEQVHGAPLADSLTLDCTVSLPIGAHVASVGGSGPSEVGLRVEGGSGVPGAKEGRSKGRMLLASVSGSAGGALTVMKKAKATAMKGVCALRKVWPS